MPEQTLTFNWKLNLEDKLDDQHPDWIAIAPGLYVDRIAFEIRKYYAGRIEASRKYMESLETTVKNPTK